jgi:glycosyltransferase involved in cell wall biosynthesis
MSLRASVIIPAYNAEPFIARAIDSVRAQSRPVEEIVVGVDGSTDKTVEIARSLGANVVELPRGNVSIARNAAVRASSGEILMFLDADDWWAPTKVATHLGIWESGASFGAVIDRVALTEGDGTVKEVKGPVGDVPWAAFTSIANWTCGSAPSMRRETFEAIGGFNEQVRYLEDVDIVIRATHQVGLSFGIEQPHTHYFLSPGSASKRFVYPAEQVEAMLSTWHFASLAQIRSFRRLCLLLAARRVPFPSSLSYLAQAGWPVGDKMFWRCLAGSFKRIAEARS